MFTIHLNCISRPKQAINSRGTLPWKFFRRKLWFLACFRARQEKLKFYPLILFRGTYCAKELTSIVYPENGPYSFTIMFNLKGQIFEYII